MSIPHSAKSSKAKSVKAEKAVADAKAGKESSAKGEAKTAGPKGALDAKAGKEASAKGAEKAASEKSAAKSEKVSQGKYVLFVVVRILLFEVN